MIQSLREVIDNWLAQQGRGTTVVSLQRRPWEYATSARLELIDVELADGTQCALVLKHVGVRELSAPALRVKPLFVIEPLREIEVYRRLLAPLRIGPALVASSVASLADAAHWLLIERVAGRPLFEAGDLATWIAVAASLRELHRRLAACDDALLRQQARLLQYDRDWYSGWMERACRFLADRKPTSPETSQAMRWLAERHPKVVEHLLGLPRTIIHGEFYASNVLIDGSDGDISMWPIDWEMAAVGPAVIDLAALTSGAWTAHERRSMIAAYAAGRNVEAIARDVDYALVHLAVQWLGWFGRRRPPADHARDWLGEAVHRAEALEL